jgi:DNA-directed RNA polymerase III subunit RPC8
MFCVEVITDTIKVQAADLHSGSTLATIHQEIDTIYPNRILMDVGLVVGRYDTASSSSSSSDNLYSSNKDSTRQAQHAQKRFITKLGHGSCQGSCSHFRVTFALIVFRPFVGEVLIGTIVDSYESGITVSLGFFSAIYVPVYWMLNPSVYDNGVWVWLPTYDDDNNNDADNGDDEKPGQAEQQRYEMNVGATIRFRVKSINYTQVTATAKGMQAVTSSTVSSNPSFQRGSSTSRNTGADADESKPNGDNGQPLRRRSSSVGLDETANIPSAMHIMASICEDGLGLTSWWTNDGDEPDDDT